MLVNPCNSPSSSLVFYFSHSETLDNSELIPLEIWVGKERPVKLRVLNKCYLLATLSGPFKFNWE